MERASVQNVINKLPRMVIDGAMSTPLEHMGLHFNDHLWTARALAEHPELIGEVHRKYFEAGADCGITCSYQATIPGLEAAGYSKEEAEKLIASSVTVFRDARDAWWKEKGEKEGRVWPLCLGACGPYGAYLADGSEYRGRYGVTDAVLREFHQRRAEILWEAGADVLLFETQPSLGEVLIEAEIAEELGADYWVSFSCIDGRHTCEGQRIGECAKQLSKDHPHLKMIGVNCTKPEFMVSLIRQLRMSTDLPIAVYPNSGETYDPVTKTWSQNAEGVSFGELAYSCYETGAYAVGGCCTTDETHIREVANARNRFLNSVEGDKI